jgi:hypothetical protein
MGQIVSLGLDNYSHLSQRAELINVTQVPTQSGNANVQLATFPNVKMKTNNYLNPIGEGQWLFSGEKYLDVKMSFNWVIIKAQLEDGTISIELHNLVDPNAYNKRIVLTNYTELINNVIPFKVLEFTDLNALRWVVILTYNTDLARTIVYRFRADSRWNDYTDGRLIDSHFQEFSFGIDMNSEDKLYEVFIQGEKYYEAKTLFDYDNPLGTLLSIDYTKLDGVNYNKIHNSFSSMLEDYVRIFEMNYTKDNEIYNSIEYSSLSWNTLKDDKNKNNPKYIKRIYKGDVYNYNYNEKINLFETYLNKDYIGENSYGSLGRLYMNDKAGIDGHWYNNLNFARPFSIDYNSPTNNMLWPGDRGEITDANGAINNMNSTTLSSRSKFEITAAAKKIVEILNKINNDLNYVSVDDVITLIDGYKTIEDYFDRVRAFALVKAEPGVNNNWSRVAGIIGLPNVAINNDNNAYNQPYSKAAMLYILRNLQGEEYSAIKYSWDLKLIDSNGKATIEFANKYGNVLNQIANLLFNHSIVNDNEAKTLKTLYANVETNLGLLKTKLETLRDTIVNNELDSSNYSNNLWYINSSIINIDKINDFIAQNNDNEATDDWLIRLKAVRCFSNVSSLINQLHTYWKNINFNKEIEELLNEKADLHPLDIETISHMLVLVTKEARFYYSDVGKFDIQSLNFYSAEYANSDPAEFWRLGNRLVLFTNNTIEFWDITNDFNDPLSPAYSSNVYSMRYLKNTIIRFSDIIYFIGKPIELNTYSVYSLSKTGQLKTLSYPQLDAWINKQIITDYQNYRVPEVNINFNVNSSIINYENTPIIQWNLRDKDVLNTKKPSMKLNYNLAFNTFFLSNNLYFLQNDVYFQMYSNKAGTLNSYVDDEGKPLEAIIRTVNTNFDPKKRYKTVAMFHGDVDLQDHRNFINTSITRPSGETNKTVKSYWNKIWDPMGAINVEDYQTIRHKFYRVSNQPSESLRNVLLQPKQGERNVIYRIIGIGMGIDFQTEVRWNGFLRINNLAYEVE